MAAAAANKKTVHTLASGMNFLEESLNEDQLRQWCAGAYAPNGPAQRLSTAVHRGPVAHHSSVAHARHTMSPKSTI